MKSSRDKADVCRLEKLREVTRQTWDEVAAHLGLKRSMVFHVLAGRRSFSEKSRRRLLEREVAAGIRSQASALIEQGIRGENLIALLLKGEGLGGSGVSVEDIDVGFKEIRLEYRRGRAPTGYPARLRVRAAPNLDVWRIIGEKGASENPAQLLASCLEDLKDKPDLLERLTPTCYARILDCALDLTFGLHWRAKLRPSAN